MTDLPDLLEEPQTLPRRGFNLGAIVLIAGVVFAAAFFGIALAQRNQTQLTSGPAPDFTIPTYAGGTFTLSDQLGKVVVINFWASWCIPCRAEAPALQAVWERYQNRGVVLVGVDYVDTEKDARAFIEEFNITYPNGPDVGTKISDAYQMRGVPETFIVDQDGNITQFLYGGVTESQLNGIIDDLLAGA